MLTLPPLDSGLDWRLLVKDRISDLVDIIEQRWGPSFRHFASDCVRMETSRHQTWVPEMLYKTIDFLEDLIFFI